MGSLQMRTYLADHIGNIQTHHICMTGINTYLYIRIVNDINQLQQFFRTAAVMGRLCHIFDSHSHMMIRKNFTPMLHVFFVIFKRFSVIITAAVTSYSVRMNYHPLYSQCFCCQDTTSHKLLSQVSVRTGQIRIKCISNGPVGMCLDVFHTEFFCQCCGIRNPFFPVLSS